MKQILMLILTIFFLSSCYGRSNESRGRIENGILEYIKNSCKYGEVCKFTLNDITDFQWGKFFFFDMAVEGDVVSKAIGKDFTSASPYYSRKWFFMSGNEIVKSEQHLIPDVDIPIVDGDIVFDLKDAQSKYGVFDSTAAFEVEKIKTSTGEYYRLKCVNCSSKSYQ
jgi:hypothetical protein